MGNLASLLVILLSFVAAFSMRFGSSPLDGAYLNALLAGLLLCSVVLPASGAYREEFKWDFARRVRRLVAGWALVVTALVAIAALLKLTAVYSRIWFGLWVLFGVAGLLVMGATQHAWLRYSARSGRNRRRMVLVGGGEAAERIEARLSGDSNPHFDIVARFGKAWSDEAVAPLDNLSQYLVDHSVDDVWIATDLDDRLLLEQALDALKDSVVDVYVVPDLSQYRLLNQQVTEWRGLPVISLSGTPMTGAEWRLKAAMDRIGAFSLIVATMPLLLGISFAVKVSSPGPVIFRQRRHGIGGDPINVLKFRTMKHEPETSDGFSQARPGDQRVTWIGSWLRRSSLDELPQLFNVLKGEMSLVGPRPHPLELNDYYLSRIPRYMLRHKARPGITGWAQVNGLRGMTDTEEKMQLRIEHDLWYIQNWSLWLDLQILMRTPFAMTGRNAF
jgi:putative colanic acid biosynthesis UDP-glucose lipid carrier transferase